MRRSFFWLCFRRATGWERACEERAPQCSRGFSVSVVCRPSLPPSLWLSSGLSHSTLPPLPPSLPSLSVLEILEFTSARKRMSVIVESVEDGQILVLAKGADTAMGPRLSPGQVCLSSPSLPPSLHLLCPYSSHLLVFPTSLPPFLQAALLETTLDHMKRYASEGLRTLMICCATLSKEAFGR